MPHLSQISRLGGRLSATVAALAVLATASVAQTVNDKPEVKTQVLDRVTALLTRAAYVPGLDFEKWKTFVETEKAKLDESKDDDEFSRAINEALARFGASHIYLATPKAAETRRSGSTVGIGITQQKTDDGTLVVRVIPGAPADKGGLKPGDIIVKVDGQPADGAKGIAGAENTKVVLTVKNPEGKTRDVTLTRAKFSTVRPEELIEVDKDTARLAVYTFDLTYDRENVEKLMLKAQKYKNLMVDLRDNGGGAVVNLQHLLGMLMPEDKAVGTFINRSMVGDYTDEKKTEEQDVVKIAEWSRTSDEWDQQQVKPFRNLKVPVYKGKVAVLINKFSGSASEICAAALHDVIGADIVGTKSAGAVLVSVIVPASNGFTLQYPIMDYVTVSGLRIEGNGVTPTVEAEDPKLRLPNAKDPVVEKASALLVRANLRNERSGGN